MAKSKIQNITNQGMATTKEMAAKRQKRKQSKTIHCLTLILLVFNH